MKCIPQFYSRMHPHRSRKRNIVRSNQTRIVRLNPSKCILLLYSVKCTRVVSIRCMKCSRRFASLVLNKAFSTSILSCLLYFTCFFFVFYFLKWNSLSAETKFFLLVLNQRHKVQTFLIDATRSQGTKNAQKDCRRSNHLTSLFSACFTCLSISNPVFQRIWSMYLLLRLHFPPSLHRMAINRN